MAFLRKYGYYLISIFRLLAGIRERGLVLRIFLGRAHEGLHTISLNGSGLKFRVRKAMDVWSVKETFLDKFYEKYGFKVGKGWKMIDIGAGIGEFTLFAAHASPENRVLAFEPFPESFRLLQENLTLNRIGNVQAFPRAIAAQAGQMVLDFSAGEPLQIQSRWEGGAVQATDGGLVVECLSLPDAMQQAGWQRCDLLKLDCEGAEYEILFGLPAESLQRIERMVMEYHDHVTSHTHRDLVTYLKENGFAVRTKTNVVHAYLGYLWAWRE